MKKSQERKMKQLMRNGKPRYIRVYDNGGDTADRYTVLFTGRYRMTGLKVQGHFKGAYGEGQLIQPFMYIGMSSYPAHPQGICLHGETDRMLDHDRHGWPPDYGEKCHLGTRIHFEDLPKPCQLVVVGDYARLWGIVGEDQVGYNEVVAYWNSNYEKGVYRESNTRPESA